MSRQLPFGTGGRPRVQDGDFRLAAGPRMGKGRLIDHYDIRPVMGRRVWTIPAEEVIRFSYKNPQHKIDGWAPLSAGSEWVDTGDAIDSSRFWSMKFGAEPRGMLELGPDYQDPDTATIEAVQAKFMARYSGTANAGKPMILPPGAKFMPLTIAPANMGEVGQSRTHAVSVSHFPEMPFPGPRRPRWRV